MAKTFAKVLGFSKLFNSVSGLTNVYNLKSFKNANISLDTVIFVTAQAADAGWGVSEDGSSRSTIISSIIAGEVYQVARGTIVAKPTDVPAVPVTDVTVDGTSVLEGGVAKLKTTNGVNPDGNAFATKGYVDSIKRLEVVVADELPEASADTMDKLYLIPKAGSEERNIKEEWITIDNGAAAATRYVWEKIGDTEIDLSGYLTKTEAATIYATITNLTDVEFTLVKAIQAIQAQLEWEIIS